MSANCSTPGATRRPPNFSGAAPETSFRSSAPLIGWLPPNAAGARKPAGS
jgi:hypothetical protein